MSKFCISCGGQVRENAKFCEACGQTIPQPFTQPAQPSQPQTQYQQQAPPHPQAYPPPAQQPPDAQSGIPPTHAYAQTQQPPAQQQAQAKKKKTPIIVAAGAAVIVVALIVAGLFTNGFGLFGDTDGDLLSAGNNGGSANVTPGGDSGSAGGNNGGATGSGSLINIPADASDEEILAYNFLELAVEFYEQGVELDALGFIEGADYMFSFAASSTASMRYAVDCLLEMQGVYPNGNDERLRDWDSIAALGWASPFPYFFEGVVLEARGDGGSAECYRKAALNPNFIEGADTLKVIKGFDKNALESLRAALEELEDHILDTAGWLYIFIERHENNFDVDYLRNKAMACLETNDDLLGALGYYLAALRLNPFDGDSYAHLVVLGVYMDDGDMAASYLEEGLLIDPENAKLAYLRNTIREATGK